MMLKFASKILIQKILLLDENYNPKIYDIYFYLQNGKTTKINNEDIFNLA